MRFIIIFAVLGLTGCATPPQWLANYYDSQDPCQNYYKVPNYQYPSFCGAGKGARIIQSRTNSNGVYVRSHMRSNPDNTTTNNYYTKR